MKTIIIVGVFLVFLGLVGGFAMHSLSAGVESSVDKDALRPSLLNVSIECPAALWPGCAVMLESRKPVELSYRADWLVSTQTKELARSAGYQAPELACEWTTDKGVVEAKGASKGQWEPGADHGIATVTVTAKVVYKPVEKKSLFSSKKKPDISFSTSARQYILIPSTYDEAGKDPDKDFEIGRYAIPVSATAERYPMMYPEKYKIPTAFYKVTRETAKVKISPRFTIGDFDLYYDYLDYSYPQYIAVDKLIVIKLEELLDAMNQDGFDIPTFTLISGFRPPSYNRGSINKGADLKMPFSRHQYGDAVDLLVDVSPEDGIMDDLNKDGTSDIRDAAVIQKYVNRMDKVFLEEKSPLLGGAGIYSRHDIFERPVQSPYIHIDTRGYPNISGHPVRWIEDDSEPEPPKVSKKVSKKR